MCLFYILIDGDRNYNVIAKQKRENEHFYAKISQLQVEQCGQDQQDKQTYYQAQIKHNIILFVC